MLESVRIPVAFTVAVVLNCSCLLEAGIILSNPCIHQCNTSCSMTGQQGYKSVFSFKLLTRLERVDASSLTCAAKWCSSAISIESHSVARFQGCVPDVVPLNVVLQFELAIWRLLTSISHRLRYGRHWIFWDRTSMLGAQITAVIWTHFRSWIYHATPWHTNRKSRK